MSCLAVAHLARLCVYLTDDGSTDGTTEMLREKYPQVKVVSGNGNLFWDRGMHAAWREAVKGDTYFHEPSICRVLLIAENSKS